MDPSENTYEYSAAEAAALVDTSELDVDTVYTETIDPNGELETIPTDIITMPTYTTDESGFSNEMPTNEADAEEKRITMIIQELDLTSTVSSEFLVEADAVVLAARAAAEATVPWVDAAEDALAAAQEASEAAEEAVNLVDEMSKQVGTSAQGVVNTDLAAAINFIQSAVIASKTARAAAYAAESSISTAEAWLAEGNVLAAGSSAETATVSQAAAATTSNESDATIANANDETVDNHSSSAGTSTITTIFTPTVINRRNPVLSYRQIDSPPAKQFRTIQPSDTNLRIFLPCSECNQIFSHHMDLHEHAVNCHIHVCSTCQIRFETRKQWHDHMDQAH